MVSVAKKGGRGSMAVARNIVNSITEWLNLIGIAALVLLMSVTVVNIVVRMFGRIIIGAYELSGLMLALAASSAIVYRALKAGHLMVDVLFAKFPPKTQKVIRILTAFTSFVATGFLAAATIRWIVEGGFAEKSEVLLLPVLPFECVWALGLVLLCVIFLLDAIDACKGSENESD